MNLLSFDNDKKKLKYGSEMRFGYSPFYWHKYRTEKKAKKMRI